MKLLTKEQVIWILTREIKINKSYSFPEMGFGVYIKPSYGEKVFIETNPFFKSLAHERFKVKEIKNGFVRGNFEFKPKGHDMWILQSELENRNLFVALMLLIFCFIPFVISNKIKTHE